MSVQHGADDADAVDTVVVVEPGVFDGDHRITQMRRHARQLDLNAILSRNGEDLPIVRVEHHRAFGRFRKLAQLIFAWKARNHLVQKPSRQDAEQ